MIIHTFECIDGTKIAVRSLNARKFWTDSCPCEIVLEIDTQELDFILKVCELHKGVRDVDLVSTLFAHSRSFNLKFGEVVLTKSQHKEISQDKKNEMIRIKSLGIGEIRADSTTKTQIETDLRSKNR